MRRNQFFQFLEEGEIADINYPLQGVDIIFPHGKAILNNIESLIKNEFLKLSYSEVDVPEIVPPRFVAHLRQYDLFKAKNKKRQFYLAGSSEIQTAYLAERLIKSHKELPLRLFSISKVRREIDSTSLIKNIEFRMFEINSFFETAKEAYLEIERINKSFRKVLKQLNIPHITVYENFDKKIPSIIYTYFPFSKTFGAALWVSIPDDYYTKVVDFSLSNSENKQFDVIQLNGAFTGRLLATYLAQHLDKDGFIIDPILSDFDAIVVKNKYYFQNVKVKKAIEKLGLKVKTIITNNHDGITKKFCRTGIPLLLEPGMHEIRVTSRDKLKSFWLKPAHLKKKCLELLRKFSFRNGQKILLRKVSTPKQTINSPDDNVFVVSAGNEKKFTNSNLKKIGYLDSLDIAYVKRRY